MIDITYCNDCRKKIENNEYKWWNGMLLCPKCYRKRNKIEMKKLEEERKIKEEQKKIRESERDKQEELAWKEKQKKMSKK